MASRQKRTRGAAVDVDHGDVRRRSEDNLAVGRQRQRAVASGRPAARLAAVRLNCGSLLRVPSNDRRTIRSGGKQLATVRGPG